jgi:hypothetical protein
METGKSSSGWVGAAALGLGLIMACLEGKPDPGPPGIIRDGGPNPGGKALAVGDIAPGSVSACPDRLMIRCRFHHPAPRESRRKVP